MEETLKSQKLSAAQALETIPSKVERLGILKSIPPRVAELGDEMYEKLVDFVKAFGEDNRVNTFPCKENHNTQSKFGMYMNYIDDNGLSYTDGICGVEVDDRGVLILYKMEENDFDYKICCEENITDDDFDDMDTFELPKDLSSLSTLHTIIQGIGQFVEWQLELN